MDAHRLVPARGLAPARLVERQPGVIAEPHAAAMRQVLVEGRPHSPDTSTWASAGVASPNTRSRRTCTTIPTQWRINRLRELEVGPDGSCGPGRAQVAGAAVMEGAEDAEKRSTRRNEGTEGARRVAAGAGLWPALGSRARRVRKPRTSHSVGLRARRGRDPCRAKCGRRRRWRRHTSRISRTSPCALRLLRFSV